MSSVLNKRIFSSIILISLIATILNLNNIFFLIFLIIVFSICSYEWLKLVNENYFKICGLLFLIFSFYTAYKIKVLNENNIFFYFTILVTIGSDLGGYIFGKIFKGPKLTHISPNKTYSGAIGSFVISFLLVIFYIEFFDIIILNLDKFSYKFILLIIILSFVSQLGDLVISYFKRIAGLKDTGNLIPGHGGFLDRLDGAIFVFPFFYIIIKIFS
jgi:phosphatidate cytidylyltransferase